MGTTVLVLGATGRTGRRLVAELLDRGVVVRAASRNPGRPKPGVEPVRFEWSDRRTYGPALEGADGIYQVLQPAAADATEDVTALLDAATTAGVRRLVHLSNATAHLADEEFPMRRVEHLVEKSPVPSTILRPNVFDEIFTEYPAIVQGVRDGVVTVPAGDGRVAPVSVADVAAVAAVALTEDGHEGKTYAPTGPDALSFAELTDIVSASAGRQVRYRPIAPDEFRSTALGAGVPVHVVDFYAAMYDGIRQGWAAQPTDDVLHVTGRAPIAFAEYARGAVGAWR
ncbi:NmrA family NAD(P)-binding protein [Actinomadura montaniterrae]|uniref:NAD(P)H-binding protein n=1 Tax=Actinomadura montaniterrae TaxID=1803903 RepID=A0A6L3VTD9_9ACTN|nr:NmrA family NAD(P)-binding protein [Actinomadura montaniterrae]KAB2375368.1 NAD(P)H-binding protein [Actinomadura montaniterrae]